MTMEKITFIQGTPWTISKLSEVAGISKQQAAKRLRDYKAGSKTADETLAENNNKSLLNAPALLGGAVTIDYKQWTDKKTKLLANALLIAAIMPTSALAESDKSDNSCPTRIIVTPPFTGASIDIFDKNNKRVYKTKRSSVLVPLQCGKKYTAKAKTKKNKGIGKRLFFAAKQVVRIVVGELK